MSKHNEIVIEASNKNYIVNLEGDVISPKNRSLKTLKDKGGYHKFTFRLKGERVTLSVHRLQAYQKYGKNIFEKGIVVRHLNGNSSDNSFDNIAIGTASNNMQDKTKENRILDASHPIYNHESIIKDRENGMKYTELMLKYDIPSKGTISYIINSSLKKQGIK